MNCTFLATGPACSMTMVDDTLLHLVCGGALVDGGPTLFRRDDRSENGPDSSQPPVIAG